VLKPLTLSAQVTYVSSADPAVDWDAIVNDELDKDPALRDDGARSWDQKREIAESRFVERFRSEVLKNPSAWGGLLKFKTGEAPTKFVIGVIPPEEMARIADDCRIGKQDELVEQCKWRAFLAGLRGIENFGSGSVPKKKVGEIEYVDPAWLRERFSGANRGIALGVGLAAWIWNQLRDDDVKN
jgi:hypothetical protein